MLRPCELNTANGESALPFVHLRGPAATEPVYLLTEGEEMTEDAQSQLANAFEYPEIASRLRSSAPTSFEAASRLWQAIISDQALSPRLRELVLLALHASVAALNE